MDNQRPGVYNVKLPRRQKPEEPLTAIMDFEGGSAMVLRGELPPTIWLNGTRVKPERRSVKLDAPAGKNRLLLVYPPAKRPVRQLVLFLNPAS